MSGYLAARPDGFFEAVRTAEDVPGDFVDEARLEDERAFVAIKRAA
jgi:hypothetical protein